MGEYGLIAALIAVAAIGALGLLGAKVRDQFNNILGDAPPVAKKLAVSTQVAGPVAAVSPAFNNPLPASTAPSTAPPLATTPISPLPALAAQLPADIPTGSAKTVVQTVGSLGSGELVLAYMQRLEQMAAPYAQSDPATYNALIALGLKGKEMADAVEACNDNCKSGGTNPTQRKEVENLVYQFMDVWQTQVHDSNLYQSLSSGDQTLLQAITVQSAGLAAANSSLSYTPADLPTVSAMTPIDSSLIIQDNSDTTIRCGQNGKC
jgi:hypothetical protein